VPKASTPVSPPSRALPLVLASLSFGSGLVVVLLVGYIFWYSEKLLPGVYIDDQHMGGMSRDEASRRLAGREPAAFTIETKVDDIVVASSSTELGVHRSVNHAVDAAFSLGHEKATWRRVASSIRLLLQPSYFETSLTAPEEKAHSFATAVSQKVDITGKTPEALLGVRGSAASLTISPGNPGRSVRQDLLLSQLRQLPTPETSILNLPIEVASSSSPLTPEEIPLAKERAAKLVGKSLQLDTPDQTLRLSDQDLINLMSFPSGLNHDKVATLLEGWRTRLEREPQSAKLEYDAETLKVHTFVPPKDGLKLHVDQAEATLVSAISEMENQAAEDTTDIFKRELPLRVASPAESLEHTNNLGIKELVGKGESEYGHSAASRQHNVALAAKKINDVIIKPGAEFSFNKTIGDVSQATGFMPAYVIKNGQTVLGDGGGVCQVSTTVFRAALDTGLPITKRKAHSYRVSYYELDSKPGVDATVYTGDVDLRFVNDTPNHLLMHTYVDPNNLYMQVEFYGTSDGRTTELTDHKVWGFSPPPPPVYIPSPTLPTGKLKQIDWSASGIKASFKNIVRDRDGNVIREDVFNSNYVPWSAKFLRGV
jgi:vancomycin resistance protein YoaR